MTKIYKSSAIFISLFLVFSLLPLGNYGIILSDDENESGEIKERIVKESGEEYVAEELIVRYQGDAEPFRVVKLSPGKSVREAEFEFESRDDVEYAEPNYIAQAFFIPNDPYYSLQWHFNNATYGGIQTQAAWDVSTGAGVTVAVVDTGVAFENYRDSRTGKRYYKAPDLASTCFVSGYDFVENDTHPNDDNSHGTHVAGTISQSTNNGIGVAGVAFGSCLQPIKVLDRNGSGTYANVANGIRFAADNGAKIINLSLGGPASSQALLDAVAYAYNKGVTIVAAAGNDGTNVIAYPAAYDAYVIAVGATRYDETLAYYSNFGSSLDLVAPGGDLRVDQNSDGYGDGVLQNTFNPNTKKTNSFGYWFFQGTSMAAPHVSGVAALVIATGLVGPDAVRNALQNSAEDLGAPGWDATYGWGLINAAAALGPIDASPTVTITDPLNNAKVSGLVSITATANDDVGITQVNFYADGILLGSDLAVPYSWTWNSTLVLDGTHTLTATAIDTKGQTGSNSINVLVDNVNDLPVANAGPDQTVIDTNGDGVEPVTLNGSASFDPDGTIASYEWREGTALLGTTATITANFAVGTHTITLTVTDNLGATASDTAVMTVQSQPAVNVNITRFDARDIEVGDSYNIRAQVANLDPASVTITLRVRVYDSSGATLIDGTLPDKVVTISGNTTVRITWQNANTLTTGSYLAKVVVLENPAVQASDLFTVE